MRTSSQHKTPQASCRHMWSSNTSMDSRYSGWDTSFLPISVCVYLYCLYAYMAKDYLKCGVDNHAEVALGALWDLLHSCQI